MYTQRTRNTQGFGLLELVVTVAIIGIITTLIIPNLLEALDRGRQNATKADIRSIATALERFAIDHQAYPVVDKFADLRGDLEPKYIKKLPLTDGWNHPWAFETNAHGDTYTLSSPGKDGEFQDTLADPLVPADLTLTDAALDGARAAEPTIGFAADIICIDGVILEESSGALEPAIEQARM